jgi:hypothetical protein
LLSNATCAAYAAVGALSRKRAIAERVPLRLQVPQVVGGQDKRRTMRCGVGGLNPKP